MQTPREKAMISLYRELNNNTAFNDLMEQLNAHAEKVKDEVYAIERGTPESSAKIDAALNRGETWQEVRKWIQAKIANCSRESKEN